MTPSVNNGDKESTPHIPPVSTGDEMVIGELNTDLSTSKVKNSKTTNSNLQTDSSNKKLEKVARGNTYSDVVKINIPPSNSKISHGKGDDWNIVSRRKFTKQKRSLVVGSGSGDSLVEGVEKYKAN